jgi:hypothetical protein
VKLWVVLKVSRETGAGEFVGVFDSQERADSEALSDTHMVGPCDLNYAVPDDVSCPWPGAYYPKAVTA